MKSITYLLMIGSLLFLSSCASEAPEDAVDIFHFDDNFASAFIESREKTYPSEDQYGAKNIPFTEVKITSSIKGPLVIKPDKSGVLSIPYSGPQGTEEVTVTFIGVNLNQANVNSINVSVEDLSGGSFKLNWLFSHGRSESVLVPVETGREEYYIFLGNFNKWKFTSSSKINVKNLGFTFRIRNNFKLKAVCYKTKEQFVDEDTLAGIYFDKTQSFEKRNAIYLATGKSLIYEVRLPKSPVLSFGVKSLNSKATFSVEIRKKGDETWKEVDRIEGDTQKYIDRFISLKKYAKKKVLFRFSVLDKVHGFGLWSNPLVFSKSAVAKRKSVVIYLMDAMRADYLGCYGFVSQVIEKSVSPTIDRLADKGVLFEKAYAPSTWTHPSVALLFTGFSYSSFPIPGVVNYIPDQMETMTEAFRKKGFITIMITETPNAYVRNNISGFDYIFLHPQLSIKGKDKLGKTRSQVLADPEIFQLFKKVLKMDPLRPIFLYIHMRDPHNPFLPSLPIVNQFLIEGDENRTRVEAMRFLKESDQQDVDYFRRLYQASITQSDKYLANYLDAVQDHRRLRDSYLILTADHGEMLGEEKLWAHGWDTDHDGLIHIPYIWIDRERSVGVRRKEPVKIIDTFPSLMSLYDFTIDSYIPLDGQPLFGDELTENIVPSRKLILIDFRKPHSVILQDGHKYPIKISEGSESFSEMLSPEINQEIRRILEARKKKKRQIRVMDRKEKLVRKDLIKKQDDLMDPNELEILRSLGYIK